MNTPEASQMNTPESPQMNMPDGFQTKSRKPGKPWVLIGLCAAYLLLYLAFVINEGFAFDFSGAEPASAFLLVVCFILVFALSWFRPKIAGYLFVSWYIIMIALACHVWTDAGMTIILGFPVLPIGLFYVLHGYRKGSAAPGTHQVWNLALRILALAYLGLYLVLIPDSYPELAANGPFGSPVIYLELLFLLFAAGVVFNFINELAAGILFVAWYAGILLADSLIPGLSNSGPFRFMGLVVLVQGILCLVYWFYLKPRAREQK
jgi:hypothetical protein